jgi:hypothetical protein
MEQISIRAVIVSNLVHLGLIFSLVLLASMAVLATGWIWAGFPEGIKPVTEGLRSSSLLIPLIQAVSVIPASVLAGYLAGRMAHCRPVLHGALSTCAWILLLILIILSGPPMGHPPHGGPPPASQAGFTIASFLLAMLGTTISIGTPLLGTLGGVIAQQIIPAARRVEARKGTVIAELLGYLGADRKLPR